MSVARFSAEPMNKAILRASPAAIRVLDLATETRLRSICQVVFMVRLGYFAAPLDSQLDMTCRLCAWINSARGIGNKSEGSGYRFQGARL